MCGAALLRPASRMGCVGFGADDDDDDDVDDVEGRESWSPAQWQSSGRR